MVIELNDGLARCPDDRLESLGMCVENLLIGYYEGNYLLVASRPFCAYLRGRGLVKSDRALKALHFIEVGGGFIPDVLWRLEVVLNNPDPAKHEVEFSFFNRTVSTQPAAFLCENLDDIKFYLKLVRLYYPETPIKAAHYHGGGDTTVEVFSYLKGLQVVCLVILDSDVKYPGCKIGKTASKCIAKYKKPLGYIEVKILDVHEAENLVPIAYMKTVACKTGKTLLARMVECGRLNDLLTYDVKSGIQKIDVEGNANYKDYCEDLYNALYHHRKASFDKYLRQKREPDDFLFSQVKNNLLDLFIHDKKETYPNDLLTPKRKAIADLVHTFVCCRGYDPLN